MSDTGVAVNTGNAGDIGGAAFNDVVHKIGVAFQAIVLEDPRVPWLDLNRLVKVLEGETLGMPIAVVGLGDVFRNCLVWKMAINTAGGGMVARFAPGIVLIVHDVAIDARLGVRAEVGKAPRIRERDHADTYGRSNNNRCDCAKPPTRNQTRGTIIRNTLRAFHGIVFCWCAHGMRIAMLAHTPQQINKRDLP
jgi:hypothetical protein